MSYANTSIVTNRGGQYRSRPRGQTSFGSWQPIGATFSSEIYRNQVSVSTPNFRLVKRSQLPEHPHSRDERDYQSRPLSGGQRWSWSDGSSAENQFTGWSNILGFNAHIVDSVHTPPDGPIDSKAISKLLNKLSETKGSLAVSVAEIDKTARMVASAATRLVTAYRGLRSGNLGKFADSVGITFSRRRMDAYRRRFKSFERRSDARNFASKTWLELTYGWRPLVNDVYTQCENLSRYLTHRQGVVRESTGYAQEERITEEKTTAVNSDWNSAKTVVCQVRIRYTVRYKVPSGSPSFENAFGLNNPYVVAWELLPFSFVADWFVPVGDFLSNLTATNGLSFHSGTRSRSYEATIRNNITAGKPYPDQGGTRTPYLDGTAIVEQQKRGKSRTVLLDFPSPRLGEFKWPQSVDQALSALSLIQVVFTGSARNTWRL